MLVIVLIMILVLGIIVFKRHAELLLNFLIRGVFGAIIIYFANETLAAFDIGTTVGINAVSLLTSATLGMPGVVMLYGMMFL